MARIYDLSSPNRLLYITTLFRFVRSQVPSRQGSVAVGYEVLEIRGAATVQTLVVLTLEVGVSRSSLLGHLTLGTS